MHEMGARKPVQSSSSKSSMEINVYLPLIWSPLRSKEKKEPISNHQLLKKHVICVSRKHIASFSQKMELQLFFNITSNGTLRREISVSETN